VQRSASVAVSSAGSGQLPDDHAPSVAELLGDMNGDDVMDFKDINPFVGVLSGGQ
jgi:hypothetical protein